MTEAERKTLDAKLLTAPIGIEIAVVAWSLDGFMLLTAPIGIEIRYQRHADADAPGF